MGKIVDYSSEKTKLDFDVNKIKLDELILKIYEKTKDTCKYVPGANKTIDSKDITLAFTATFNFEKNKVDKKLKSISWQDENGRLSVTKTSIIYVNQKGPETIAYFDGWEGLFLI